MAEFDSNLITASAIGTGVGTCAALLTRSNISSKLDYSMAAKQMLVAQYNNSIKQASKYRELLRNYQPEQRPGGWPGYSREVNKLSQNAMKHSELAKSYTKEINRLKTEIEYLNKFKNPKAITTGIIVGATATLLSYLGLSYC